MGIINVMAGLVCSTGLGAGVGVAAGSWIDRLLDAGAEELIIWTAVVAALLAVGIYLIGKVRSASVQHEPTASELISKFRESHSRGELSDEEFRTIKTTLGARLQEELNDDGETG